MEKNNGIRMAKRHQGEALHTLMRKSKIKGKELASIFEVNPSYLSRLKRYEDLTEPIIEKAVKYFGVPRSYFEQEGEVEIIPVKIDVNNCSDMKSLLENALKENDSLKNDLIRVQSELNASLRRELDLLKGNGGGG